MLILQGAQKVFWGWWIVAVSFIANFMVFGARHAFGVFLLPISQEMGWSRAEISAVFTVTMVVGGLGSIPFGRWTDKYSPQVTMSLAALVGFIGYALAGSSSYLWQIFLFYGLIFGIGQAGIFVPSTSTVRRWFSKKVGLAMGITVASIGAGGFLLAPLTQVIIEQVGWRMAFVVIGILGLITVVPTSFYLMRSSPESMGLVPYGYEAKTAQDKSVEPRSYREIFKDLNYWLICFSFGLAVTGIYTVSSHIVAFSQELGIGAREGAMALSLIAVSSFVGRLVMGVLSDYIGLKRGLILAIGIEVLAGVLLLFVATPGALVFFSLIAGFGYGSFTPLYPALLGEMFGNADLSLLLGIANAFPCIGAGLGALAAGLIYDLQGEYTTAFYLILACFSLSFIFTLSTKMNKQDVVNS